MMTHTAPVRQSHIARAVYLCSSGGVWMVTAGFALLGIAADLAV